MSQNRWEETDINSSIYAELNTFLEQTRGQGREEVSLLLKDKLQAAQAQEYLDLSLLWLNEYQLLNKNDAFGDEVERQLAPLYDQALAEVKRACTFFKAPRSSFLDVEYFRNRYAGQRCFIIGNGPSLNKVDLKKLKDEFTFGVNSIFLARDKMGFEPTFYCVEDTHVAKDRQREIQNINSPVKVFGHYLNKVILPHPHNLFLNILLDYRRYTGFPYFSVDASRRLWVGGSVSYVNMQLAYYMGFDQVYLIGFDHEYTIPDSAIVKGADIHSTTEDPNHFHPDYFGKGYNWHVPLVNRMELGYLKARRAFALDGREIVNLTPGGHLEVFRRGDYDAVVDARPDSARGPEDVRLKDREVKISVVVPSYNVESCLMDTLDSIQAQSFLDFEIIIVNDGSTDSTLQVAQDYADRFPNTRVISQENRGLGGARNTGLRESRGRYCTFVDSDDLIMPDMLLELYSEAERSGAEIVQCGYERRQNGKTLKTVKASVDMTGFSTLVHMATGHSFSAWAKLYRIDFLREHDLHFEDHVYHEDIEFTLKAHHFATKARTVPYIGYVWMVRDGSITSKVKEKHIVDISHILRKIKAFYVQEKLYDRLHRRYYSLCYRLFLIVLERIYGEKDLWERTLLLRTFRRELEAHDLDFYEYIWEANSSYKNTLEVIKKAYQLDMCFEKQPGKDQAKAAAPSAAPSAVRGPAPEKPFRRIRKLFRDPYKFFNDSKSPLKGLRVLFLPEK